MVNSEKCSLIWSDYFRYRIHLRGFSLEKIETILRYSTERYFDTITRRQIVVGKHDKGLVIIPYEEKENALAPITIHATSRQQLNFRLKTGRFVHE